MTIAIQPTRTRECHTKNKIHYRGIFIMIIEINETKFDEVVQYCWEIAIDKTRYGFPRFETYEHLCNRFLRTLQHQDDKILAYYEGSTLLGVLNLYVEEKEKYLQGIGGIFTTAQIDTVAGLFIEYIQSTYQGYELYFGFPKEHGEANQYFKRIKATPMDASLTMKLVPQDFSCDPIFDEVIKLDEEHLMEYAAFHDLHNPNMYWNGKRIRENFNLWHIFYIKRDNCIVGSIFIKQNTDTQLEIYGISITKDCKIKGVEEKLLGVALTHTLTPIIKEVLFFIDEDNQVEEAITKKLGFKLIDTYRSYKLKL